MQTHVVGTHDALSSTHKSCIFKQSNCKLVDVILFCRVCHCSESDKRGQTALSLLDILPPSKVVPISDSNKPLDNVTLQDSHQKRDSGEDSNFVELSNPKGEALFIRNDSESSSSSNQDALISLGCSCKGDLALAHYSCALKWFVSHGSCICEVCESVATNIRLEDFKKVTDFIQEYDSLRERNTSGGHAVVSVGSDAGVDTDDVFAIRWQMLSEVSLWFTPQNRYTALLVEAEDPSFSVHADYVTPTDNSTNRWVLNTGILVASGLMLVLISWLVAPHVGKKIAIFVLYVLLSCECALTLLVIVRSLFLSSRCRPFRYWAIVFVSGFLVFGVWAQRTRPTRLSSTEKS